ncbi:MAG: hypothetical protein D6680_14480 [Cyanobacteria bacterium J007]|nr:MAG: hypothetical protein D6680_14480 [Cyanobacteria bacterium J007]
MLIKRLALRLGFLACLSSAMVVRSDMGLASPNPTLDPTLDVKPTAIATDFPRSKQNTRPVPPTDSQSPQSNNAYTQQELEQLLILIRGIRDLELRPQQEAEINTLIDELEDLKATGDPVLIVSERQARQVQSLLASLTPEEIEQLENALELPAVEIAVLNQQELADVILLLEEVQNLRLRPTQATQIQLLIQDLKELQAQGDREVFLSPGQSLQLKEILDSLSEREREQIEASLLERPEVANRWTQEAIQELVAVLEEIQRLNLRPQQNTEISSLIASLEARLREDEAIVVLSEEQAAQIKTLLDSLTPEEIAQIEETLPPPVPTARRFTAQEVQELLQILRFARDLDLTEQQQRQVDELLPLIERLEARGDSNVILSGEQVRTLDLLINSLTRNQLREIARALGVPGTFPAISNQTPTGFGSGWGNASVGFIFNQRNRFTDAEDGAFAASIGFGDPEKSVGLSTTLSITGLSNERGQSNNFGAGSISLQASRNLPNNFAVGVGVQNLVDWDNAAGDTGRSFYGVVSKILVLNPDVQKPFSLAFVSLGLGNGIFRTESNFDPNDELGGSEFNVFGSFATTMGDQATAMAEWTGRDLTLGVSVVPFRRVPLVTSFGILDLTGNTGDGVRLNFSIVYGISF